MITQTITASMTQTSLPKILTRRYDVGREVKFILYKDELLLDPIDLTDYTVVMTVIKPDNNFVIQNFSGDTVTITEQMEVVTGTGYYCVHVTKGTETIYTGQGEFIIDDVLISDEELESISEVNGLRFPDDFLTVDDHVAVIDDDVTSTDKTWSSSKISYEIDNASVEVSKTVEGNPVIFTDGANAPLVKCVTAITGYQSGTGTPSPDNVRPIVAYTNGDIEIKDVDGNTTTHATIYPSAIYRGSEDCVNGEVVREWGVVDLGDLTWIYSPSTQQFRSNYITDIKEPPDQLEYPDAICEIYETRPYSRLNYYDSAFTVIFSTSNDHGKIYVKDSRYTDVASFASAVSGVKLAYKLATPTTSSVTPTNLPIKSLNGYNHIESSTGDMEIEYITQDYQPLVDSIEKESGSRITKLWDDGFTPSPGVWLEYDFGEDLENYDALVIDLIVSGFEGDYSDTVTIYPKLQHLNTKYCYHYITGDYGTNIFHISGTTYGLGAINGNYPPQYKAVYGIKY